ncbi:hypothetical protein ACIPW5_11485 [Streptomyces sp. NPDC090077]|uniref:hypothetical protein n=1 Tax=Streptomyces sp. NPDC090077 TaxID=3365938 RepID=UPI00381E04BF
MANRTATSPDNQPFDFNLDTVEAEVELRPFRVHFGGHRYTFTHLQGLDVWGLVELADSGDTKATLGILKAGLGSEFDEFRKNPLPQYKLKQLFKAYQKHCGLEPGESDASES